MPAVVSWIVTRVVSIAPFMGMYLKYRVVQFSISALLFGTIFAVFKTVMQWVIDSIMVKMVGLDLPCMASYIINQLDVISMMNFGLSLYASIFLGRYLFSSVAKLI